ncbi:MAG: DUF3298 and DUF4163 domain-containing protein [Deltaproteobacteria bacterium]|jgi:hypothetical protein|nr:DUF3298 and DUF4163 domain-containing protein [Deltaproteobacteria bacterium]
MHKPQHITDSPARAHAAPPPKRPACLRLLALCGLLLFCPYTGNAAVAPKPASRPAKTVQSDSYTITQRDDLYRVNISYPRLGTPVADAELAIWAREQADAFIESVRRIPTSMPFPCELDITYEIVAASPKVVSVVFFISTFMGGAHPDPGLATFVYERTDGRRLSYEDFFANNQGLIQKISQFCRAELSRQLGERVAKDMLEAGTEPVPVNFDLFVPTPSGLRIYFPPYQAAPYSEGYLDVAIPLTDLEPFKPQRSFWDKD